jgi:hypothetical protein
MYKGIFIHPNTLGLLASILLSCLWSYFMAYSRRHRPRKRFFICFFAAIALCVWAIVLSGSRTSLVAATVASIAALFLMVRKRRKSVVVLLAMIAYLGLWAFQSTETGEQMIDAVMNKNNRQYMHDETLSGRAAIWTKIIEDSRALGNGSDYFGDVIGISSHNSVMRVLGERGVFAAALLACFGLLSLVYSYQYAAKRFDADPFSAGPFLTILTFWTLSFAEGVFGAFGTGITLAMFLSAGITAKGHATAECKSLPASLRHVGS